MDSPREHIGSLNESALHAALKEWYREPGDQIEVTIDNYVTDLQRGETLIEIQTSNFASIKSKLKVLLKDYKVILVYPVYKIKWVIMLDPRNEEEIRKRRSPRTGRIWDIFDELLRVHHLLLHHRLSIEVLLTEINEYRCQDNLGSWRRKGVSIVGRELVSVFDKIILSNKEDYLKLLPDNLNKRFTNKMLAEAAGISIYQARKVSYTLKKISVIKECGKTGRELEFEISA
ncbi:hypothetical protein JW877_00895 [bacterium]|nr:hypothetical protein [bacterium]